MIKNIEATLQVRANSSRPLNKKRALFGPGLALLIALSSGPAAAQKAQHQSQPGSSTSAEKTPDAVRPSPVLVSPEEDYRIGAGDVIEVQVEDMPEVSKSIRVTAAGTFLMPILGRMKAQGKTPEALAQEIADKLRGDYLKDPKVSIVIREYNSRSFFIQGAVRNPGVFQIEGRPSLLTLITLAGGLADNHGSVSFIIRRVKQQPGEAVQTKGEAGQRPASSSPGIQAAPGSSDATTGTVDEEEPKYELLRANINSLYKGNFGNNAYLQPGDIVNIPPADVFYVAGEVKAPGSFSLKEGTTLRQAVSLAQGTNFNAAIDHAMIFRDDASGKRQEIPVDIGAVMKGKKEDVTIMANDIIIVPNSRMKSFGGALIKAFGLSSVARVPIP